MGQSARWLMWVAAAAGLSSGTAAGSPVLVGTYHESAASKTYDQASSIPVSSTDLINGLAPIATNYVGTWEAEGGTTAPMTDGRTSVDPLNPSEPTSAANALFDWNVDQDFKATEQPWYVRYELPGGVAYDLTSIVVTSGHQDSRSGQYYNILTSTDGLTFTALEGNALGVAGSVGFVYQPFGRGGAIQSVVTDTTGVLAHGVRFVEFRDIFFGDSVYRELDVFGVPEAGVAVVPEPSSLTLTGLGDLVASAPPVKLHMNRGELVALQPSARAILTRASCTATRTAGRALLPVAGR